MTEFIQQFETRTENPDGAAYVARVYGKPRKDGTWVGWLEFEPANDVGQTLVTDQETSQPNRKTLEYWASGLEPIYLDGALARAQPKLQHSKLHALANND